MKEILNVIHKTIYQFFDACEDDAPMSDKDKLLLEVNKAICNNLKALEQEPCNDAISRQAAIDALMELLDRPNHAEFLYTDEICRALNHLPSVEPERKTGKWIEGKKTPGYIKWNCSECGLLVRNPQKPWYEYCPKCGSDMREVDNE